MIDTIHYDLKIVYIFQQVSTLKICFWAQWNNGIAIFSDNIDNPFPKISQCVKMTTRNSFANEKMNHHYQAEISNQFLKTVIKYILKLRFIKIVSIRVHNN